MKRILAIVAGLMLATVCLYAQDYVREGNTFVQVEKPASVTSMKTHYTWRAKDGKNYPVYITKNNRCYIEKISKKTGKPYKYYLPDEISEIVAREIGREIQKSEEKK